MRLIHSHLNIKCAPGKLREGLVSSKRRDQFAIEGSDCSLSWIVCLCLFTVYETSFHLAILFESPRQTTAIMSHLIPDLYSTTPTPSRYATTLVSLLHHLVAAYPSQGTFRQHLASLPKTLLPLESRSHKWIVSLALSLRSLNYSKFEEVTRHSSYTAFFEFQPTRNNTPVNSPTSGSKPATASLFSTDDLPREAAHILVDALRTKAREKTWQIICSAYRELSCNPESRDTRDWLERSLTLSPGNSAVVDLDSWLEKKSEEGQVKKKDGAAQGRWILCKTR